MLAPLPLLIWYSAGAADAEQPFSWPCWCRIADVDEEGEEEEEEEEEGGVAKEADTMVVVAAVEDAVPKR